MRSKFFLAALLWAAAILLVMCTSDARAFFYEQTLNYELDFNPDFSYFLWQSDIALTDTFYLLQKTGHMFSFGILYILVFNWLKNHYLSFGLCLLFAFSSEIIQLFFQRDGRIFDVGVDLMGILLASILLQYFSINKVNAN